MSEIKPLIDSLRSMELPKGADSILSNILDQYKTLTGDRDDLKTKVDERQNENSELRQKLQDAKSSQLSAADLERWNAYKALGSLDEVKAKVEGYGDLEAKDQRREREDQIKGFGFKPSIFELIAEGKPFRAEGEDDDRSVYLTVDDKEVELTEYASERGLDDLLSVMGASAKPQKTTQTHTSVGTRERSKAAHFDEDRAYEERSKRTQPI